LSVVCMLPPPPTPPPSPYTTLFRSTDPDVILPGQLIRIPGLERERYLVRPGDTLSAIAQAREIPLSGLIRMNPQVANPNLIYPGDRKSTRLNSSHVKISYAVFCLKK